MRLMLFHTTVAAALVAIAFAPAAAQDEVPAWAEDLQLTVFGGPPSGVVTLSLNGDFVAEFDREPPVMTEIADLLRHGQNELTIEVRPGELSPAGDFQIAIAPIRQVSSRQSQAGRPIAHVTVPGDLLADEPCTQTIRFWAGPPPATDDELKQQYFIVVAGPPVRHLVSVTVNGNVVVEALEGDAFYEITGHVTKGRNEVEYSATRSCLSRTTARSDDLEIYVSPAREVEANYVEETGAPTAIFRLSPNAKKDEINRKTAFRGQ